MRLWACCLLCAIATTACAQRWELKKEEDGIQVFTANTPNSDFKSVKVEFNLRAKPSQLVACLLDVDRQGDWVYSHKYARLLRRVAENEMIFVAEVSLPWPIANREYISDIVFNQPTPQLITIDAHAEPDLLPPNQGRVRVRTSRAHWDVTRISDQLLHVVYTVQFDPAGALPAWLTNMFVTKAPMHTFRKLRECVGYPVYQNAHFSFIKDI